LQLPRTGDSSDAGQSSAFSMRSRTGSRRTARHRRRRGSQPNEERLTEDAKHLPFRRAARGGEWRGAGAMRCRIRGFMTPAPPARSAARFRDGPQAWRSRGRRGRRQRRAGFPARLRNCKAGPHQEAMAPWRCRMSATAAVSSAGKIPSGWLGHWPRSLSPSRKAGRQSPSGERWRGPGGSRTRKVSRKAGKSSQRSGSMTGGETAGSSGGGGEGGVAAIDLGQL